jgi:hypothetical protein
MVVAVIGDIISVLVSIMHQNDQSYNGLFVKMSNNEE